MRSLICVILCIALCLSFSMFSSAEQDVDLSVFETIGETVYFGHYEQDNDIANGKEPIKWTVIDVNNGKCLLLSEKVLASKPFNNTLKEDITWENCSLRVWLNDDFFQTAFSSNEREVILLSQVDNSETQDLSTISRGGSNNTEDSLFILSYTEAKTFFDSRLLNRATASNVVYQDRKNSASYFNNEYAGYWLRSPGYKSTDQLFIVPFQPFGVLSNPITFNWCGVRPALWIDLNSLKTNPDILNLSKENIIEGYSNVLEDDMLSLQLDALNWDGEGKKGALIDLRDINWKMWLPEGFVADELTEADIEDNYIGYYLRDNDIIAVQYSDNSTSLAEWQKELTNRGFMIEGLYNLNGSEAVLYRDEDADTMTASVLDGKGKLLEVTFYPYSSISEEADSVISSIQQEASKKRLSGAAGSSKRTSGSKEATDVVPTAASQEEAYQEMVDTYKAGKYEDSYSYYEQAKGYQDVDKYGNLLKARLCFDLKLKDSEIETLEKAIVNDIDFADSKDVLVCNSKMAHFYLLGYWRTSNGMHGYEVRSDWYSNTTVPAIPKSGDYYTIMDGTYWSYFDGKWDDRVAQYKFTPISKSKMEMYSYQAKQSYTFSKIR